MWTKTGKTDRQGGSTISFRQDTQRDVDESKHEAKFEQNANIPNAMEDCALTIDEQMPFHSKK